MAAVAVQRVDKPMRKRMRKYGHPRSKNPIGWRPPTEQLKFLHDFDENLTKAHERVVDIVMDAKRVLGDDFWSQVEIRAYTEHVTEGEALGAIAKEALEKKGKR